MRKADFRKFVSSEMIILLQRHAFEFGLIHFLINCLTWQVIEDQVDMPIGGAVTLYVSLLTFTLNVHCDRLDYVDQVLVYLSLLCVNHSSA